MHHFGLKEKAREKYQIFFLFKTRPRGSSPLYKAISECKNCAAAAESSTFVALRVSIFDSKLSRTDALSPFFRHDEKGLHPLEISRAKDKASNKAWLAP